MLQRGEAGIKSANPYNSLILLPLQRKGRRADARGAPARGGVATRRSLFCTKIVQRNSGSLLRIICFFDNHPRASVTHVESANPENNVLGDVGGVIRDALQIARGQNELKLRRGLAGIFGHPREKMFEDLIAIAVHHIVRLKHLSGQDNIAENQCPQAAPQHSADGAGHWFEVAGGLGHVHSRRAKSRARKC